MTSRDKRHGEFTNEELYTLAKNAINTLFCDTSVPQSTTRENLQALIDEIEMLKDTLKDE